MNDYLALLQALTRAGVDYVVVGGTAAVLHGASTVTYDLDVLMAFSEENCERLLTAVAPLHPRFSHSPDKRPVELDAAQLSSFKNLYLLTDLGRLDVLGSLPPVQELKRVFETAEVMDVGGVRVRILSLDLLLEVKAAMNRPKDRHVEMELRAIAAARRG